VVVVIADPTGSEPNVEAGSDATLTVAIPTGTSCAIVVTYKSGPSSASGLYAQRARAGRISWTWTVGSRTTPGRWPIDISCGLLRTCDCHNCHSCHLPFARLSTGLR
jgi:hypothetical protein